MATEKIFDGRGLFLHRSENTVERFFAGWSKIPWSIFPRTRFQPKYHWRRLFSPDFASFRPPLVKSTVFSSNEKWLHDIFGLRIIYVLLYSSSSIVEVVHIKFYSNGYVVACKLSSLWNHASSLKLACLETLMSLHLEVKISS